MICKRNCMLAGLSEGSFSIACRPLQIVFLSLWIFSSLIMANTRQTKYSLSADLFSTTLQALVASDGGSFTASSTINTVPAVSTHSVVIAMKVSLAAEQTTASSPTNAMPIRFAGPVSSSSIPVDVLGDVLSQPLDLGTRMENFLASGIRFHVSLPGTVPSAPQAKPNHIVPFFVSIFAAPRSVVHTSSEMSLGTPVTASLPVGFSSMLSSLPSRPLL